MLLVLIVKEFFHKLFEVRNRHVRTIVTSILGFPRGIIFKIIVYVYSTLKQDRC